jgi:xylan 1,4-beta-xylosidase
MTRNLMALCASADREEHCETRTMPTFIVDLSQPATPFPHYWEYCVGSCHAALGVREDWRRQLRRCHDELGFRTVRFHGLLCDDMSVCTADGDGLVYSFFNVDSVFDFLLAIGMKPFVELSFMPSVLASGTRTIFHYRGNVTPPQDYGAWGELVRRLTRHLADRYGIEEVGTWPFEVWNEPNLDAFWAGSQDDYFRLYREAANAVKSVGAGIRVGGPATAQNAWIPELRAFCDREGVPLDFVTTHHYPTDAVLGWDWDMTDEMARAPRGILRDMATRARREAGHLPLYYTEWNCSAGCRTPYQDESYLAAFVIKTVADNQGLVDGYSFWTFSDIFEEMPIPSQPFHGGFGLLTLHGVPKPVYRAFEVLHRAGDLRLAVRADPHPTVDVLATGGEDRIQVLASNHNVPLAHIADEEVAIVVTGLARAATPRTLLLRIDAAHANPKRRWQELGCPEYPDSVTLGELMRASALRPEILPGRGVEDGIAFDLNIPPHGVAVLEIEGVGLEL